LRDGDIDLARQNLERAPESLRGWEWDHFYGRLDESSLTLQAGFGAMTAFSADGEEVRSAAGDGDGHTVLRTWRVSDGVQTSTRRVAGRGR